MNNLNLVPKVANSQVHVLGEGPFWDYKNEEILWVDIKAGIQYEGKLKNNGTIEVLKKHKFENTVSAVAAGNNNLKIIANGEFVQVIKDEEIIESIRLLNANGTRRLNDGKPDPLGRYFVGSLAFDGKSTTEQLFMVDTNRNVIEIDHDLTLSNGLAWNVAGNKFYSIDTFTKKVFVRDYETVTGKLGDRKTFFEILEGYPDGMCIDSQDHLWIAIWGTGEILRISPNGKLVSKILVPAPHTTCVTFAGPNLDVLVITTAADDLNNEQLIKYPNSGCLFTVRPGVTGIKQSLWSGFDD